MDRDGRREFGKFQPGSFVLVLFFKKRLAVFKEAAGTMRYAARNEHSCVRASRIVEVFRSGDSCSVSGRNDFARRWSSLQAGRRACADSRGGRSAPAATRQFFSFSRRRRLDAQVFAFDSRGEHQNGNRGHWFSTELRKPEHSFRGILANQTRRVSLKVHGNHTEVRRHEEAHPRTGRPRFKVPANNPSN